MTKPIQTQWYASWFDTPYYHILYKDRDYKEAQGFMDRLTHYLNLPKQASLLDLACGKGRHSIYLNTLGYHVTGVDLSEQSISYAKQFENETLSFQMHDMSTPYPATFDAVFNLFTSFGYFDDETCNLKTIAAIKTELNANGIGVIDFMNVPHVINNLIASETKEVEGIAFQLKRYHENGYIIKDIAFNDGNKTFQFQERVKAFTLQDFEDLFAKANVQLLEIFGDYELGKYHPTESERLIMLFK